MGDIQITITGSDLTTGALTMSDQGTSNAIPGDQVTWIIAAGSGVASITGIVPKPQSIDIFTPPGSEPAPVSGSTSWQGTINPDYLPFQQEEYIYTINWTTAGTGWLGNDNKNLPKSYDPKIIVKPVTPKK
ncbi:MAG TPA: hypothetical protein VIJ92_02240 [Ginsengibacter sp.]